MARVFGPSRTELDARGDEFAARVTRAIRTTLRDTATQTRTVDDLARIQVVWRSIVKTSLAPHLRKQWDAAAQGVRTQLEDINERISERDALALVAAIFEIPKVSNPLAETFMSEATNRLVAIGDVVWYTARGEMLTGLQLGEGVAELRERVKASANVSSKRAEVIARTEVNSAMNNGAYQQMKALDVPTIKEWIATNDARTRESHAEVDGEEIDGDAKFMVGGFPMDHPHDLNAPPELTINCRCTLAWEIIDDEDDYEDELVAGAFHLPGRHDQKRHGNRKGKSKVVSRKVVSAESIRLSGEMRELLQDKTAFHSAMGKKEDRILHEIFRQQGFDAKPQLAPSAEVTKIWQSGQPELWRGVSEPKYVEQFKTGDYYAGVGIHGNGTYAFAAFDDTKSSSQFAQKFVTGSGFAKGEGTTLRMVMQPGSRVAEFDTLLKQVQDEQKRLRDERSEARERGDNEAADDAQRWYEVISDPGRFAALQGYDAIEVMNINGKGEFIVLNRGATVVDREV